MLPRMAVVFFDACAISPAFTAAAAARARSSRACAGPASGSPANAATVATISATGSAMSGEPMTMMESGAILIYLAGKTGKLLPASVRDRYVALQWLMFQMGGVGPIFGQVHHFLRAAKEQVPYAIERYTRETRRLYSVLNERLKDREFLADGYSVADIATYPWVARYEWHKTDLNDFPHVKRWFDAISARPAVQRGMIVPQ